MDEIEHIIKNIKTRDIENFSNCDDKKLDIIDQIFNTFQVYPKNKSKSKVHLKEIRMNTVISEHDMGTKLNQCCKFLNKGYKVKLAVRVNDRLRDDETKGFTMVDTITEALKDLVSIATQPSRDGR